MNAGEVQKRLAAVIIADVVGYTRLMEEDTDGTVAAWQSAREQTILPLISNHGGRIVKLTGDGFLAEFSTVQQAVSCAVDMQNGLAASSLEFRMGVNLGDIVDDGEDIHGEGVNIAARIETLCEPGGICISGDVYNQVRNRLDHQYSDLGEHEVKHVSAPVRVYAITISPPDAEPEKSGKKSTVSREDDKPSIAVLPFDNMSGDVEQEYFVDGMTEDIITELSRNRWMTVIARNTTFTYKGRAVNVSDVASELDVRYVIEGSVRKSGERMRITVQLIDGATGNHIWAERYDRQVADLFDLQDEITRNIAAAVEPEVFANEGHNASIRNEAQMSSWETVMKARTHFWRLNSADVDEALRLLKQVVEDHPDYPFAKSALAFVHLISVHMSFQQRHPNLEIARQLAQKAVSLDEQDAWAHISLGYLYMMDRETGRSLSEFTRALELNPNSATAFGFRGLANGFAANYEDAFSDADHAIRLSPRDPQMIYFLSAKGVASFNAGELEGAIKWMDLALLERPELSGPMRIKSAALAYLGRLEEAMETMARYRSLYPDANLAEVEATQPYPDEKNLKYFIEGLRMAGLE